MGLGCCCDALPAALCFPLLFELDVVELIWGAEKEQSNVIDLVVALYIFITVYINV